MKREVLSQMELLREKIEENKFTYLKMFPNKYLLGKSKILKFKNNNQHFDERCALFMEYTYLLLRIEVEQSTVYLSRNIFINHFGEIYYFYTFDPQHAAKLVRVNHGNLVQNIISVFNCIFLQVNEELLDYEHKTLYENTIHCLIPYFDDLKQKSEKYYYQTQEETNYNCEFKLEPSNPYSVLVKLESFELYKEYNFPIKYNTAILIRGIIDLNVSNALQGHYVQLANDQEEMIREVNCLYTSLSINKCVSFFYLKIFRYLQLLQQELYLKVTFSQSDLQTSLEAVKEGEVSCMLTFQSNLRKEPHINKTQNEKSSQSSIRNDKEQTKEQKEKSQRQREYLQSLSLFKSKINFNVKLQFKVPQSAFEIEIQAISLWTIDEIYFINFLDFWTIFMNNWYIMSEKEQDNIEEKIKCLRFEVFHRNKNIGIKTKLRLDKDANMIEELILNYDKIAILYLCFEKILKKMYKLGNQFVDFNERSLEQLRESVFIENKIFKLKEALKKYSAYYREFIALVKSK